MPLARSHTAKRTVFSLGIRPQLDIRTYLVAEAGGCGMSFPVAKCRPCTRVASAQPIIRPDPPAKAAYQY